MAVSASVLSRIRGIRLGEETEVSALAIRVFDSCVSAAYGSLGTRNFHEFASPAEIVRKTEAGMAILIAEEDRRIIGMAGLMTREGHLSMLFVDRPFQGTGIGMALLRRVVHLARDHHNQLTVNSSPNAESFYARAGFKPIGPEMEQNGIRFRPMAMKLH